MTPSSPHVDIRFIATVDPGLKSLTGIEFDPDQPYRCCLLCGAIYQPPTARNTGVARQLWAEIHAKSHSEDEHASLANSGRFCTPEAAFRLAPFGVFSLTDLALDNEVMHALKEAPRAPINDVEDR